MFRTIVRDRDVVSGAIFIVLGAAAIWRAGDYALGTLTDMGPGYFPTVLGALLVFFGVATLLGALLTNSRIAVPTVAARPVLAITASTFAFALLLDRIGLPLTVLVSSLLASAGRPRFLRPSNFLLAAILAALCVVLFVRLLGVPMRLLPPAVQGY